MKIANATTIQEYLNGFPEDQKKTLMFMMNRINALRDPALDMVYRWGMITREVPFSVLEKTYNKQPLMYLALWRQKNYYALYLVPMYMGSITSKDLIIRWFERIKKTPNMGKSCIRFKEIDDIPWQEIGDILKEYTMEKFVEKYKQVNANVC